MYPRQLFDFVFKHFCPNGQLVNKDLDGYADSRNLDSETRLVEGEWETQDDPSGDELRHVPDDALVSSPKYGVRVFDECLDKSFGDGPGSAEGRLRE